MIDESKIKTHYEEALLRGADSGQQVGWRNSFAQLTRFKVIARLLSGIEIESVSDFGCGTGDLRKFLRESGWAGAYFGADLSEKMIDNAKKQSLSDEQAFFTVSNQPSRGDVVIASGLFNVSLSESIDTWEKYCKEKIAQMWEAAEIGIAFNMLSTDSDRERRKQGLAYGDPGFWMDFVRASCSPCIRIDQSYGQFDFSLAAFKVQPEPNISNAWLRDYK